MFKKLSKDERGSIDVAAYVLLATLIGIGMIVGVDTFRTSLTQEYGDAAAALERLDQSYEYTIRAPSGALISQSVNVPPNAKGPNDSPDVPPPGISIAEGVDAEGDDGNGLLVETPEAPVSAP